MIVTHNMQQAARVADRTAFFSLDSTDAGRVGALVEYDETDDHLHRPGRPAHRGDYVTGRFG